MDFSCGNANLHFRCLRVLWRLSLNGKSLTEENSGKTLCGAPPSLTAQYNNRDVIVRDNLFQ